MAADRCEVPGCRGTASMVYEVELGKPRRICADPAHFAMAPRSLDSLLAVRQERYGDGRDKEARP